MPVHPSLNHNEDYNHTFNCFQLPATGKRKEKKKEAWAWPKHVTSSSRSLSAEARMTLSERHVMRLPWTGKSSWRPALASTWLVHSCEPARSVRGIWQSYTLGRLLSEGAERIIMGFYWAHRYHLELNWTIPSPAICCLSHLLFQINSVLLLLPPLGTIWRMGTWHSHASFS